MFLVAFPTNLSPIKTGLVRSCLSTLDRLTYQVDYQRGSFPKDDSESLMTPQEYRPDLIRIGSSIIPMVTGIISVDMDFESGNARHMTGYDNETTEFQTLSPVMTPSKFTDCHMWGQIVSFNDLVFNLFARGTKLTTTRKILTPTNLHLNFPDEKGEHSLENLPDRWRGESATDEYIALINHKWVIARGGKLFDLTTNEPIEGEFSRTKCVAYMLIPDSNYVRSKSKFNFAKPDSRESFYQIRSLNINVPTALHDEDVGPKLLKALGLEFDFFNNPTFKNGVLDPASIVEGTKQFAVVRSKAHIIDKEIFTKYYTDCIGPGDSPKSKKKSSTFKFGRATTDTPEEAYARMGDTFLTLNLEGEITDAILDTIIATDWRIGNHIRNFAQHILERPKGDDSLENLLVNDKSDTESTREQMKKARTEINDLGRKLLAEMLVEIDINIPYSTPRFSEEIAARLNYVTENNRIVTGRNIGVSYTPDKVKYYNNAFGFGVAEDQDDFPF